MVVLLALGKPNKCIGLDHKRRLGMKGKLNKPEQIITKRREAEVELAEEQLVEAKVRKLGIS